MWYVHTTPVPVRAKEGGRVWLPWLMVFATGAACALLVGATSVYWVRRFVPPSPSPRPAACQLHPQRLQYLLIV